MFVCLKRANRRKFVRRFVLSDWKKRAFFLIYRVFWSDAKSAVKVTQGRWKKKNTSNNCSMLTDHSSGYPRGGPDVPCNEASRTRNGQWSLLTTDHWSLLSGYWPLVEVPVQATVVSAQGVERLVPVEDVRVDVQQTARHGTSGAHVGQHYHTDLLTATAVGPWLTIHTFWQYNTQDARMWIQSDRQRMRMWSRFFHFAFTRMAGDIRRRRFRSLVVSLGIRMTSVDHC